MTTSQDLDKPTPRGWRLRLRRRAPVPGADDARALKVANVAIWRLEMDKLRLQRQVDRYVGQCAPPCWHAARLEAAEVELLRLQTERADVYEHIRDVLEKARAANAEHPARDETGGDR